jgi:hypothetical protein
MRAEAGVKNGRRKLFKYGKSMALYQKDYWSLGPDTSKPISKLDDEEQALPRWAG